jgi:gliding motility-associated-like protein
MDTVYYDLGLNTVDERYYYLLELWAQVGDSLVRVGCSDPASSVYLTLNELDRSIELQWNESVPWSNKAYVIYRYDESVHQFLPLDTVDASPYIDGHLQNGISYCYYVMALGGYFSPDTVGIFLNRSQQACGVPADITSPEIPDCQITSDCEQVNFLWHFSNDSAYNDVYKYFIYYKPTHTEPYVIIDSFSMNEDCFYGECAYQLMDLPYIIGCFAMGAVDTAGNYSAHSSEFCFDWDACNPYHLPNVFTPNGDGVNDIFQPFPYDNVQKIEMYIYDRWGQLVFKTEDPDIQWNGTDMHTHRPSSDGTYYYACKVYVYSLNGVITKELHGTITLLR